METAVKKFATTPTHLEDSIFELDAQKKLADLHSFYFTEPNESNVEINEPLKHLEECLILESKMINFENSFINISEAPDPTSGGESFVRSLKDIAQNHKAGQHPFYTEYLSNYASHSDVSYYLAQETQLDPRFDDFIAYMQVGMQGASIL